MNCPSRNDDTLEHAEWNQNPPPLAADLTTCQDLNGIANARVKRGRGAAALQEDLLRELVDDEKTTPSSPSLSQFNSGVNVAIPPEKGGESHITPCSDRFRKLQSGSSGLQSNPNASKILGWVWWLLSVVCTSILISNYDNHFIADTFSLKKLFATTVPDEKSIYYSPHSPLPSSLSSSPSPPLKSVQQHAKRGTCASPSAGGSQYNTPLHVGALFIILFVSSTACAFPMLAIKFPKIRVPASFLFAARHFGTGVLLATAFVHLLPTAFTMLSNPCLSGFWTTDYPAMPGAIALAGIFFVTIIEMVFSPAQHVCSGGPQSMDLVSRPRHHAHHGDDHGDHDQPPADAMSPVERPASPANDGQSHVRDLGPLVGRTSSISRTLARMSEQNRRLDRAEIDEQEGIKEIKEPHDAAVPLGEFKFDLTPEQKHRKDMLQCMLLEMGILFHSVFIGMSLSVSTGSEFVILLIAITFHQTFEGLALGARIATLTWPENAIQPWLMALAYGCTTPVGQAIGLATHTLYSPGSEVGLLLVGTMNAISSGLLVFASLVELMSEDFLSDESWRILRGKKRVYACVLVFLGAFGMSLIGAWA